MDPRVLQKVEKAFQDSKRKAKSVICKNFCFCALSLAVLLAAPSGGSSPYSQTNDRRESNRIWYHSPSLLWILAVSFGDGCVGKKEMSCEQFCHFCQGVNK